MKAILLCFYSVTEVRINKKRHDILSFLSLLYVHDETQGTSHNRDGYCAKQQSAAIKLCRVIFSALHTRLIEFSHGLFIVH